MSTTKTVELSEFSAKKSKSEEIIKQLRKTNALWEKFAPLWNFFLSAYEGGGDFANKENLFRHQRENEKDFQDRCDRVHNLNYCESLVDFFTNFIFNEPIDRNGSGDAAFYDEFIKDVNKKGDNVDDFMRMVEDDTQIFGMSYVMVDAPKVDGLLSKFDEQVAGVRPYWVLVKPDEITDWVVDEFDKFQYLKRKQVIEKVSATDGVRSVEQYTELYPGTTIVSEIDITDPGKHFFLGSTTTITGLDVVPVVVTRHKRSKRHAHVGLSFLRDYAYNNREVMNLTSLLQEFLYRQAFNILAKETDSGSVPLAGQSEGDVGTANVLEFPRGAHAPTYLSPPAEPAKFIQDERSRIINEMFRRAAQDALSELFNGEKSSGFSQAQSFSKTVPFISSRADALERTEVELMKLTMKMLNKEWKGKIKYKDRYELTNLTDALTQLQILVRDFQIPSEEFVKTELKRLIHEFDDKLPSDQLAKIYKQIDEMNFTSWMATQKMALVGRGSSPAKQQEPKDSGTLAEVAKEAKANGGVNVAATKKLKDPQEKK